MSADDVTAGVGDVSDPTDGRFEGRSERIFSNDENAADDERTDRDDRDAHQQTTGGGVSSSKLAGHSADQSGRALVVGHHYRTRRRHLGSTPFGTHRLQRRRRS